MFSIEYMLHMENLKLTKCLVYVSNALLLSLLVPAQASLHSLWADYLCILLGKHEMMVTYDTLPVAFALVCGKYLLRIFLCCCSPLLVYDAAPSPLHLLSPKSDSNWWQPVAFMGNRGAVILMGWEQWTDRDLIITVCSGGLSTNIDSSPVLSNPCCWDV